MLDSPRRSASYFYTQRRIYYGQQCIGWRSLFIFNISTLSLFAIYIRSITAWRSIVQYNSKFSQLYCILYMQRRQWTELGQGIPAATDGTPTPESLY